MAGALLVHFSCAGCRHQPRTTPRATSENLQQRPCVAVTRLLAPHKLGDDAPQIVQIASTLVINVVVAVDHVRNNHALTEGGRAVGDVFTRVGP